MQQTFPREVLLKNWSHYVGMVEKLVDCPPHKPNYIFRGQADAQWDLVPALARLVKNSPHNLELTEILELEKAALREFFIQAHHYLSPQVIASRSKLDLDVWWILMQHYGVPTRILDWTNSPFVALYFSCEQEPGKDGALWVLHPRTVIDAFKKKFDPYELPFMESDKREFYSKEEEILFFLQSTTQTDRMVAQQMVVTICTHVAGNHSEILSGILAEEQRSFDVFLKLIIPQNLKGTFLRNLRSMNVTAKSLFPGIDGLGKSAAELLKLAMN